MAVPELDPITGRYVYVEVAGVRNRIYFEESGQGRPLVCLHTAGADSRQYRHLLCDAGVTSRWRVVAFDLPYHGRSLPPEGWWEEEYLLTRDAYVETIMSFLEALDLERPVVLGCSMGGAIVLELARKHASDIAAVIGLEAASKIEGRFLDWTIMPDVDGSVVASSWTYGLSAPQSPEAARREIWWVYSQGGPGVYRAGTYFYSVDWDLRGREGEIDTSRCPVYLLTGEYDHACSPEETFATAASIPGAMSAKMEGIGHFPMAENYPRFREYLLPILEKLSASLDGKSDAGGEGRGPVKSDG
ncbi:MAG: alpha/beta hydrolase [Actinomycetota bacterium]|nr:alpha/beta hydrolase [Actinomycetota bacterium]